MGSGSPCNFDRKRVSYDWIYNIGTGALFLIDKWNGTPYYVGDDNPAVIEDWYYAVWAYNGLSDLNNPNNPKYSGRPPADSDAFDPKNYKYPYQELVWGYANNPPKG